MYKIILILSLIIAFSACDKKNSESSVSGSSSSTTVSANTGNDVIAVIGETKITNADISKGIESDIYDAEMKVYEIKFNRLKSLMIEKLMEMDPNKAGLSNDQYLEKYIVEAAAPASEAEIQKFIVERKIPKESVNSELKDRIKNFLSMEGKRKSIDLWFDKKVTEKNIKILLSTPNRPSFTVEVGDSPFIGNKDAKVTIVEFSDFQCPFCAKGKEIVHELKNKYKDQVKIVFKQFPLPFHNQAKGAAEAALCAYSIGGNEKFWALHDIMFDNQNSLDVPALKGYAKKINLDKKAFDECLDQHKMAGAVESNMAQASSIGVKSTPTFFVNGKIVNGAQSISVFAELIDQELK